MSSQKRGVVLEFAVLAGGQAAAEPEILQRILVQDAVDDDAEGMFLEVDAVVADAEAVEDLALPLQLAEALHVGREHLAGKPAEVAENLQLEILGQAAEFTGAGRVEDDLELGHGGGKGNESRSGMQLFKKQKGRSSVEPRPYR